jgi:EAL domain-containing protein (putative c-di-GMP-specific phosphodiesterase class I)
LRQHGCDALQGFLFSPPVPADQLEALLDERRSLAPA